MEPHDLGMNCLKQPPLQRCGIIVGASQTSALSDGSDPSKVQCTRVQSTAATSPDRHHRAHSTLPYYLPIFQSPGNLKTDPRNVCQKTPPPRSNLYIPCGNAQHRHLYTVTYEQSTLWERESINARPAPASTSPISNLSSLPQ